MAEVKSLVRGSTGERLSAVPAGPSSRMWWCLSCADKPAAAGDIWKIVLRWRRTPLGEGQSGPRPGLERGA